MGQIISSEGAAKIFSMLEWPIHNTLKSLRGLLGLTRYYRKFVRHYGTITTPLTMLLKKNAFVWSEEATKAFLEFKSVVTQPHVLRLPDFSKGFIIECEAFGGGLGALLMQKGQPIAFFNKALKGKTLMLSTYEKELLALVFAVRKWKPYLLGQTFKVKIDQQALKYLLEHKADTKVQQKWISKLMDCDFRIEYKEGRDNKVEDACPGRWRKRKPL